MRKPVVKLLATATAALLLAGCAGGQVRSAGASSSTSDTFVYSYTTSIVTSLDPAISYSNENIVMENIYESLTRYDSTTKTVKPLLATAWSSSNNGKTWTFTLRTDATFHSGRPVNAEAVKASIERTKKLASGASYIWDSVKSIGTPSDDTVVFNLSYAAPLDLISSAGYAAYIYDTKASGSEDLTKWLNAGHDAGSGPYTVATYSKGSETEITLSAYADYWGGWTDTQYKKVEFRVTPEVTTAWQLLQTGSINFANNLSSEIFSQAKNTSGVQAVQSTSFSNLLLLPNTTSGPLANIKVREAISKAIDINGYVAALNGAGTAASGIVPSGLLGSEDDLTLTQDLDAAKQLLADAGYGSNGKKLTLSFNYTEGDSLQSTFATLFTSTMSSLGVEVNAQPLSWDAAWAQAKSSDESKRQDLLLLYWWPDYPDPTSWFINVFRSSDEPYFNLSYLNDSTVDAQIDSLPASIATDQSKAEATISSLQKELIQQQYAVYPLVVQNYQRGLTAGISGYVDNPMYPHVVFVHDLSHS